MEVYAWLPHISEWLLERAVQKLRKEDQDRCREEWSAAIAHLPNTFVRLAHAISFLPAAQRINDEYFEASLIEIDASLSELAKKRAGIASFCVDSPATLNTNKRKSKES